MFEVEAGADEKQQIKFVWPYIYTVIGASLSEPLLVGAYGAPSVSKLAISAIFNLLSWIYKSASTFISTDTRDL